MRALLVVDMLNDFINSQGALYVKGGEKIIEPISKLIKKNPQVVYANDYHSKDDVELKKFPPHCIQGTWGANIIPELKNLKKSSDIIVNKHALSMFTNPYVLDILQVNKINELYICGDCTEYCIKENALDALKNGLKVYVIIDAIVPYDKVEGDIALVEMNQHGVNAIKSEDVPQV